MVILEVSPLIVKTIFLAKLTMISKFAEYENVINISVLLGL